MSEYGLSLLRQLGLAARDSKSEARRAEIRSPPGYCWDELGRVNKDADDRVRDSVELVFRKFRELGSVRQVMLWLTLSSIELPVLRQSPHGSKIAWQRPGYHNVLEFLRHPIYAGAYVFGRRGDREEERVAA